ncbi:hypothetical protein AOLI_G00054340 [Acnodon oligacanthus]
MAAVRRPTKTLTDPARHGSQEQFNNHRQAGICLLLFKFIQVFIFTFPNKSCSLCRVPTTTRHARSPLRLATLGPHKALETHARHTADPTERRARTNVIGRERSSGTERRFPLAVALAGKAERAGPAPSPLGEAGSECSAAPRRQLDAQRHRAGLFFCLSPLRLASSDLTTAAGGTGSVVGVLGLLGGERVRDEAAVSPL